LEATQYLENAYIRHRILIERYAKGLFKELKPILVNMRKKLLTKIPEATTSFQRYRLTALLEDIDNVILYGVEKLDKTMFKKLTEFAEYEGQFQAKLFDKIVTVNTVTPAVEQMAIAIKAKPMELLAGHSTKKATLESLITEFSKTNRQGIRNAIIGGILSGETSEQITRNINQLVNTRTANQVKALVRTATAHASSVARDEFLQENAGLMEGEKFVAVLDAGTTLQCGNLDQTVGEVGELPRPPLHWGCRSTIVPYVNIDKLLPGIELRRAAQGGTVARGTTYEQWLRSQSKAVQDEALGKGKAELFRGGMKLEKFVDPTGKAYSLFDLKRVEAALESIN
jgi:SPP1 gp7 family putative phage head morphogenesis protein